MTADIPNAESLISIANIEEIDANWVKSSINYLDEISTEYKGEIKLQKPQLVAKLNNIASEAGNVSNIIRVLFRLAKSNADTAKTVEESIAKFSANLPQQQQNPFAQVVNNHEISQSKKPTGGVIKNPPKPMKKTPIVNSEVTLIPKNGYDVDIKKSERVPEGTPN